MPRTLQFKRYSSATLANTTGANGELIINSTNKTLTVHDGVTPGGFALLNTATDSNIDQTSRTTANNAVNLAQAAFNAANTSSGGIANNTTIDIDNRVSGNTADIRLYSADDILLQARDRTLGSTIEGGDINIYAGDSAEDSDSSGGDIQIRAGDGGAANVDIGGLGGTITIQSGRGGAAIGNTGATAESGGSLTISAGDAGDNNGNIDLGADGGDIFIESGFSTGNTNSGGDIYLTTGTGGQNGTSGNVQINIPGYGLTTGGLWTFNADGALELPQGGIIAETSINDNPTIVIAPAMATIESQVLFIKGGGPGYINSQNGIDVQTINILYQIGDIASFNIWTPDNANSTLYWWLEPAGGGAAAITPVSGTVLINEFGASDVSIDVEVLSTAPFRIYVGPTDGVTATAGISVPVNSEPVVADYHLHLTTGTLEETSIILGTDEHNVRTIQDGGIEINTNQYGEGGQQFTWAFNNSGILQLPEDGDIVDSNGDSVLVGGITSLAYLELTNNPLIIQPVVLSNTVTFISLANGTEEDSIDTGLTLTRGNIRGLYNSDSEQAYNQSTDASPEGTEWNADGWGDLTGFHTRTYTTLYEALNQAIGENIIDAELIMHDTINNKYYKFDFTNWGQEQGGAFTYTRTLIEDPNYFRKVDYDTLPSSVDIIVVNEPEGNGIGITRANNNGIYNIYSESEWSNNTSPEGTLWNIDGWNDLSNLTDRTYDNLYAAFGNGGLGNKIVGAECVMYIPSVEKYYAIKFLSWTPNNAGGGFSYNRYEIDQTQINVGIRFTDDTVQTTAYIPTNVISTADGNRRIEQVSGSNRVSTKTVTLTNLTTTASRAEVDTSIIWLDYTTTTIDNILGNNELYDGARTFEFSLDNSTWYAWSGGTSFNGDERGYQVASQNNLSYNLGDTIYFRYTSGGVPVEWWNKNNLPGGSTDFRGAVIQYHAFTGDATIIGTIHIVDDDSEEHITHTEVSSGSSDSQNDDLWFVETEGYISYRRLDMEASTLRIQWTATVFYGSEYQDD